MGRVAFNIEFADVGVGFPQGIPDRIRLEQAVIERLTDTGGEWLACLLVSDRPVERWLDMADEGTQGLGRSQQRLREWGDVGTNSGDAL